MSNEYKGIIKIKNADGILEPFLPATDVSCIDDANGTSLAQTISSIETQISIAETSGGIELMYEEPDEENTADFSNETMIAYIPIYSWSYTINTQASVSKAKVGAVPLNLYGQDGVSLQIDWGDGNTSILTPEQYTASDSSASVHTYATYGTYTITITSYSEWKNVFLFAVDGYATIEDASDNLTKPLYYWRNTLVKVNSAIPKIAGTIICSPRHGWNFEYSPNQIKYLFLHCSKLKTIPLDLFTKNTEATSFSYCFFGCTSLQSIPEGLFDKNTQAASFQYCFSGCSSIQSIPSGLFDKNTAVTTFFSCFLNCAALGGFTLHISSSLVDICSNFVTKKSGTTRRVYVPSNSTTETSFNAVASSLGLTIIGE